MIEISKDLQELYATDEVVKQLKIYIKGTDTILANDNINTESFTLNEILSDEEQICYGLCNSSKVEFTTIGENCLAEGVEITITISIGNSDFELPLGTYIVQSAKKQTNKQLKDIIAYDRIYNLDNIDMIYFYDKTIFPLTLKQLRDNFFDYVGIVCEDITLLNDGLTVNEDNDFRELSAREFLTQICELNAVFGKMSRNDTFVFLDIIESNNSKIVESTNVMVNTFVVNIPSDNFTFTTHAPLSTDSAVTGTIDWGDGTTSDYVYNTISHTYDSSGTYVITFTTTDFTTIQGGFGASQYNLIEAYISEGITLISDGSFYHCYDLQKVSIPSTAYVTSQSFIDCTNLTDVSFGSTEYLNTVDITNNSYDAFSGCTSLTKILYYSNTHKGYNKDYFTNGSSYIPVYYTTDGSYDDGSEIRKIRIGANMPSFRHINVEKESKVIWKIALGNRIIWRLNQTNEYLKSYNAGRKYLEAYYNQSVTADVYWVHEVDGVETETYLLASELQTWECDTLEPYYYASTDSDGNTFEYVGYYQITSDSAFGQHDMKMTYKSPDTGNILEIEFPIYYLEEVSWKFDFSSYDWYPFREPFGYNSIGSSTLLYQCYDNANNLIEESKAINVSLYEIAWTFPTVSNAQFQIGENQVFDGKYVSSRTFRTYSDTINVNIRHYTDSRNNNETASGDSNANNYYHKDIKPFAITYKFDSTREFLNGTYDLCTIKYSKEYTSSESVICGENETLVTSTDTTSITSKNNRLNKTKYSQTNVFAKYTGSITLDNGYNQCCFDFPHSDAEFKAMIKEEHSDWFTTNSTHLVNLSNLIAGTTSSVSANSFTQNSASCGFAYWGDGTLSYVCFSDSFYSPSTNLANKTGTISKSNFSSLYLRNGTTVGSDSTIVAYSDNPMFDNTHTYTNDGTYTVEITNFFGYVLNDEVPYMSHSTSSKITSSGGLSPTGRYYGSSISNTDNENEVINALIDGGSSTMWTNSSSTDGEYCYFAMNDITGAKNIISIDIGNTPYFGTAYKTSTYINYNRPDYINYLGGKLASGLGACKSVTIPRINSVYGTASALITNFDHLETIYYNGYISDFTDIPTLSSWIGQTTNGSALECISGTNQPHYINIVCLDGTITLD